MDSVTDFDDALRAVPYGMKGSEDRAKYHARKSAINEAFKNWLGATYASEFTKSQKDAIFAKAWEDGHSCGLNEVENYYTDVADFARKFI